MEKFDKGINYFKKYLYFKGNKRPNWDTEVKYFLGKCYEQKKDFKSAKEWYEKSGLSNELLPTVNRYKNIINTS